MYKGDIGMAKRAAGGPNKSELIRNYKKSHDDAGPTEIAAALSKDGAKVTPQFVSTVLSNDRKKGRKGRRKGAARRTQRVGGDPLAALVQAKKLADRMGGIDKARSALDALARILG
jgi:hypothetical protein